MSRASQPAVAFATAFDVAESPLWCPTTQQILGVDIFRGVVWAGSPGSDEIRVLCSFEEPVGAILPAQSVAEPAARWIVAARDRLVLIDEVGNALRECPLGNAPDMRTNDAEVGPDGSLYVGVMEIDGAPGRGALLEVDPQGRPRTVLSDLSIPNGLAWAPDDATPYFVDSPTKVIVSYSPEADGRWLPVAVHARIGSDPVAQLPPDALPDGMACDEEGNLYVAVWGGSCVLVVAPSGQVVERIAIPAPLVTSCAFGGADLRTLFVTSARRGLGPGDLKSHPLSGSIFAIPMGIRGRSVRAYTVDWMKEAA